ncbi:DUF2642 domain-containing protein [Brevibacillus daliensis]|uniref:DUF2642 domain-containing protein n=1 Tax=Brevibacillus daliensis TaxID=2892995 RepID=UPI001E64B4A0|nr:DUF2642 domain-containing protein [Brevibacillus daliensis]
MNTYDQHGYYGATPGMVTITEPYVFQTLQSLMSNSVTILTTRGIVQGVVCNVLPDHVVIEKADTMFFVRLPEIVWVMPSY